MNPNAVEFVPRFAMSTPASQTMQQPMQQPMPPQQQMRNAQQLHSSQQQLHSAQQRQPLHHSGQQMQQMPPPPPRTPPTGGGRPPAWQGGLPDEVPASSSAANAPSMAAAANGRLPCTGALELVATQQELALVVERLRAEPLLCVDCEGSDLSKGSWRDGVERQDPAVPCHGALCLLQIATPRGEAYAIDVLELGQSAFDLGLREILENPRIIKVVHDFRQDQDALWHQFRVACEGLFDCQFCDVLCRRLQGFPTRYVSGSSKLLSSHGLELVEIPGRGAVTQEEKVRIHGRFSTDRHLWQRRPLPDEMIAYAKADVLPLAQLYVKQMFNLSHLLGSKHVAERVMQVGSAIYASSFRQLQACRCRLCCAAEENARFDGHRVFNQIMSTGQIEDWVMSRIWRPEDSQPLAAPGPSKFYVNEHDESVPLAPIG